MKNDKSIIFPTAHFYEKNKAAISSLVIGFAFLKIVWSAEYTDFRADTLI